MSKIIELESKLKSELKELTEKRIVDVLKKQSLEYCLNEILKLKKISAIDKYKIVFIGPNGVGKTTLICNLFNLTNEENRELLSIGAGGTTISEVEIKFSRNDYSKFLIEFISHKELHNLIHDFALSHFPNPENNGNNSFITQEIYRALKNVMNFSVNENEYKNEINNLKIASDNILSEFEKLLLERINFDQELIKELHFDNTNKLISEKQWIKKTFADLNVCKIKGYSIPKKITIILGDEFWNDNYKNINSIIDTKGLDNSYAREDIDSYIKSDDTVCVFSTSFENAPNGDIQEFIRRNLQNETNYLTSKNYVLLIPRNDEPCNILNQDGNNIENWQEGVNIKLLHVRNTIRSLVGKFQDDNVYAIDVKYRKNRFLDENNIDFNYKQITNFISSINNKILERRELIEISSYFEQKINSIINIEELGDDFIKNLHKIRSQIKVTARLDDIQFNSYSINIGFINKILRLHFMTLHAVNRRAGVWLDRGIDLSYILIGLIRELTFSETKEKIKSIKLIISEKIEVSDQQIDISNIKELLIQSIDNSYNRFLDEVCSTIGKKIQFDYLNYDNELWLKLINEYGRGPGFVARVHNHYSIHLKSLNNSLSSIICEKWNKIVLNPILKYLVSG